MRIVSNTLSDSKALSFYFKKIWDSPALRTALVFSGSGIAFAASNLILARMMMKTEFGLFALFFAFVQIGMNLGPAGTEVIVNRQKLVPAISLIRRVLFTASLVATFITGVSWVLYKVRLEILLILFFAIIAGSTNRLASAHFQSMQRFGISLCISQNQNLFLAIAATISVVFDVKTALLPAGVVAGGYAVSSIIAWFGLIGDPIKFRTLKQFLSWREGIYILGFNVALIFLMQMEKLIVPKLMTMETLATLAVLMTFAGSPFRMLQLGVRFTILPRIRDAGSPKQRRHIILREVTVLLFVCLLISIIIWFAGPILIRWILSEKFIITHSLIFAAIIVGFIKVFDAFATSTVTAIGSLSQLNALNLTCWLGLGIAVIGAIVGANWGLTGIIYGVGAGWFFRALIGSALASKFILSASK